MLDGSEQSELPKLSHTMLVPRDTPPLPESDKNGPGSEIVAQAKQGVETSCYQVKGIH